MALPKPCETCGAYYPRPIGKSTTRYCQMCIKKSFIKKVFAMYGKYKGCTDLKEALKKYARV